MSEYPQPGLHPDPDTLSAFVEGVLPEHERLACLAHFADCGACREVVYLAQEPQAPTPNPVVERVPWWRGILKPVPALAAAVVTGILVLSVALYRMDKPGPGAPVAMMARSLPQGVNEPPTPATPPAKKTNRAVPAPALHPESPPSFSAQTPLAQTPLRVEDSSTVAPRPVPQTSFLGASPKSDLLQTQSGIAGTITDPTGARIAGAAVTAKPASGAPAANTVTDKSGQFLIAGLQPGQYELQVTQSGFQSARKPVEIQPGQLARADSSLSVGSAAESVSVVASASAIDTRSVSAAKNSLMPAKTPATIGRDSVFLPSKLAATAIAKKNNVTLAADSAGTLFRSDNEGSRWELVKAVWQGKVVELASDADAFRLKTDTGSAWLSRDGKQWFSAPSQQ
jgi:hypothetical protein